MKNGFSVTNICIIAIFLAKSAHADSAVKFQVDFQIDASQNSPSIYARNIKVDSSEKQNALSVLNHDKESIDCLSSFTDFVTRNGAEISRWAEENKATLGLVLRYQPSTKTSPSECNLGFRYGSIIPIARMNEANGWTTAELKKTLEGVKKSTEHTDQVVTEQQKQRAELAKSFESIEGRLEHYLGGPAK